MEISSTRPVSSVRMRLFTTLNQFEMTFIGFDFYPHTKYPAEGASQNRNYRQFGTIASFS